MDAATVAQLGSGEPTVMHGEADTVQATKQGVGETAKTRFRARSRARGQQYRRDVTSGTCELCIAEWTARIRDITFEFAATDGSATWKTVTPILHVGPWNDNWEVWVNPFALSTTLPHVILTVDARRHADAHDRTRIAPRNPRGRRRGLIVPPRWSTASMAPTFTTTTGTRNNSSSCPSASRMTPTKARSPFVAARADPSGRAKAK